MFSKIDVNGKNAHPLYKYLKNRCRETFLNDIKWNFAKFLVDKKGVPYTRYLPNIEPIDIRKDIETLLKSP